MKLLAIDTATEACSAALLVDGEVQERYELAPRGHAQLILPMMEELLAEAGLALQQLDALAFGRGPGSFTGVRIATGVIQGTAFGSDLPVLPISSLAALAEGCRRETGVQQVLAAIDARMGEVYWGSYCHVEEEGMVLVGKEAVLPPAGVPLPLPLPEQGTWRGVGSGWATYSDILSERLDERLAGVDGQVFPHAQDVATLAAVAFREGKAVSAEQALPVYLRDEVAWKKAPA